MTLFGRFPKGLHHISNVLGSFLLLVVMPLLLVAMPLFLVASCYILLLVARPGATSSVLAPSSVARCS